MLTNLFTSKVRIKLLTFFVLNTDKEFYVRELTRNLDEQINAIRRELDNLKKLGFVKSRQKDRKKYFKANTKCIIFDDLRNIILKLINSSDKLVSSIKKLGQVDYLLLSGSFLGKNDAEVDMLVVGDIPKMELTELLQREVNRAQPVKFSLFNKEEFFYRLKCNDRFLHGILHDADNYVPIDNLKA